MWVEEDFGGYMQTPVRLKLPTGLSSGVFFD